MSSTLEARSKYFNELTVAYFLTLTQEESAGPAGILVYSSSFRSSTVLEDIMVFNYLYTSHRRAQRGVWVVAVQGGDRAGRLISVKHVRLQRI